MAKVPPTHEYKVYMTEKTECRKGLIDSMEGATNRLDALSEKISILEDKLEFILSPIKATQKMDASDESGINIDERSTSLEVMDEILSKIQESEKRVNLIIARLDL